MPRSKKSDNAPPTTPSVVLKLDGRQMVDATSFHAVLAKAFGFVKGYGQNLDALADCLTHLDDPLTTLSKVQVAPGQMLTIQLESVHAMQLAHRDLYDALIETIAFVNFRRLERHQPPILALAFLKG